MTLFSLSLLRSRPERTITVIAVRTITHTTPTSMMTDYNRISAISAARFNSSSRMVKQLHLYQVSGQLADDQTHRGSV
jgi:hypothetical protein